MLLVVAGTIDGGLKALTIRRSHSGRSLCIPLTVRVIKVGVFTRPAAGRW